MAHFIRAIIGKEPVRKLAGDWLAHAKKIELPQGFAMVFMTEALLEDIEELSGLSGDMFEPELDYFTEAVDDIMRRYSLHDKLAYIETDYFGGYGTQGGVLYENGKIAIPPKKDEGVIDALLREMGVWCNDGKDEFDMLTLGNYRRMDD